MFNSITKTFCVDALNPNNSSRINKSMLKPFYATLTNRVNCAEKEKSLRLKSLYFYRRLLIAVDGCYDSNLHVQAKIEELKYSFRANAHT